MRHLVILSLLFPAWQASAADIDRSIADFRTPAEIRWVRNPAGSYVIHYGNKVHFDGAKGEECVIQVWGMGPATATPAQKK